MGLFSRFVSKLKGESTASALDWDELSSELLAADLGPVLTEKLVAEAQKIKGDDAEGSLREILITHLSQKSRALAPAAKPAVILVVGVNGVGKTTSVAKLAHYLQQQSNSLVLGAADTFRAAAVEQLTTWGARVGVDVVTGKHEGEPASIAFDATKRGAESGADYVLIDTAGRLHTKNDLMAELGKIKRVIEKTAPVAEVLLVIDGTTGQNGLIQAKLFSESVDVTGLIVTKLDGSARGGVALAIENQLDLPIKFIGTGEAIGDFAPFERDSYLDGLLRD
ncbi:MAG: signal recognition particle-docking protein FtsY [Candidatus Planktophila sp.]